MDNTNQTKSPFTIFGIPKKVIINGIQEADDEILECIDALTKHSNEIISFVVTYINGIAKLYVTTV